MTAPCAATRRSNRDPAKAGVSTTITVGAAGPATRVPFAMTSVDASSSSIDAGFSGKELRLKLENTVSPFLAASVEIVDEQHATDGAVPEHPPGSRPYAESALEFRPTGEYRHTVPVQCAPGLAELPEERLELPASSPVQSLPPWRVDDHEPRRVEWLEGARVRLPHLDGQARTFDVDPSRADRVRIIREALPYLIQELRIDFVDDLDFDGKTRWLVGQYKIPVKNSSWDSLKVAAGPPPIKTKEGWLFIYHAIDEKDDIRYKIGAMLLDIKEPTRVLARTKMPILEPLADYENEGLKYGVVYPCGAVVISDRLFVYYGGADMVTCVATAKMSEFMTHLSYEREEVAVSYPLRPNPDFTVITKEHIEGFCMKCRKKVEIKNPFHFIMKNLRHAVHGICPKCGTKIVKFGKD